MEAMIGVRILLGETLVKKNGEGVRKSGEGGLSTCKAHPEGRQEWGEDVGWSILDAMNSKGGSVCWGGMEPPSSTLSPSITS